LDRVFLCSPGWPQTLFFYYSCVHTMFGSFLPPSPTPSLNLSPPPSPPTPQKKLFCPYL
jgi:hypothetical protein